MEKNLRHKLYMGFRGLFLRVPLFLSERGSQRGERGAKDNSKRLTDDERRVHHYIVLKMMSVREPFRVEELADEMKMARNRMMEIVEKLENLKTFIYRSDGKRIDWAYPLSLTNTGFRMSASSGEQFFAA